MSEKNKKSAPKKLSKSDKFWRSFLFTEDGKPKSGFGVNSFFLSLLFLVVFFALMYGASFLQQDFGLSNLLVSPLVAIVGTAICCVAFFFFRDKRYPVAGFLWLDGLAVACAIYLLIYLASEPEAQAHFLRDFFLPFILVPLVVGTVASLLIYRYEKKKQPEKKDEPEWKKYVNPRG